MLVVVRLVRMLTLRVRIPVAYPEGPVSIRVISGKSHGVESPVRPLGGCWFFHITFKREGKMFQELRELTFIQHVIYTFIHTKLASGWTSFLYCK